MKVIEDEGFCTACGFFGPVRIGDENFSLLKKDLANYKKYKDIFVDVCEECGFVSTNLTAEEGVIYGAIKNTKEYKELFNYEYLNGLDKELYDFHSAEVPANFYEAYSIVAIEQKDYEKAIRTLYKTIELKKIMARKYRISKAELGGEEENDHEYDELNNLILKSIEKNQNQIISLFDKVENKNIYLKLIFIENLIDMNNSVVAKNAFLEILNKINLEKDLKEFFTSKLEI